MIDPHSLYHENYDFEERKKLSNLEDIQKEFCDLLQELFRRTSQIDLENFTFKTNLEPHSGGHAWAHLVSTVYVCTSDSYYFLDAGDVNLKKYTGPYKALRETLSQPLRESIDALALFAYHVAVSNRDEAEKQAPDTQVHIARIMSLWPLTNPLLRKLLDRFVSFYGLHKLFEKNYRKSWLGSQCEVIDLALKEAMLAKPYSMQSMFSGKQLMERLEALHKTIIVSEQAASLLQAMKDNGPALARLFLYEHFCRYTLGCSSIAFWEELCQEINGVYTTADRAEILKKFLDRTLPPPSEKTVLSRIFSARAAKKQAARDDILRRIPRIAEDFTNLHTGFWSEERLKDAEKIRGEIDGLVRSYVAYCPAILRLNPDGALDYAPSLKALLLEQEQKTLEYREECDDLTDNKFLEEDMGLFLASHSMEGIPEDKRLKLSDRSLFLLSQPDIVLGYLTQPDAQHRPAILEAHKALSCGKTFIPHRPAPPKPS